jgi:hypothetical protein
MSRAIIVANKIFEADPLVEFLTSPPPALGKAFGKPGFVRASGSEPRWRRGRMASGTKACEIVCIQDAIPQDQPSSSKAKADKLPDMLAGDDVAIVIAFGTATAYSKEPGGNDVSSNGCVVVGTSVFVHDPRSKNSKSDWKPPQPDTIVTSSLGVSDFDKLFASDTSAIQPLLVAPPRNPACPRTLTAAHDAVAVSAINITSYTDYFWSDLDTVAAYFRDDIKRTIGSLETTHGVIRLCTDKPFAFVSGIVDRFGHFSDDVDDLQNFAGAHNAAAAIGYFIVRLLDWLP